MQLARGRVRLAERPADPDRPGPHRFARRRVLQGLASVLIVPGGGVWPIGGYGVRLNDTIAPNGTFLPAGNMTVSIASGLTNGVRGQAVASATCTGIDPTRAAWFFTNQDNMSEIYGGPTSLFAVTPITGQSVAAATMAAPGLLAARPEGHTITLGVTDGLKTCLNTFVVPCTWATASIPTLFVGRGMLAAHGSNVGYEHFSDLLPRLVNQGGAGSTDGAQTLENALRGATVVWMPDSDRDYYANDVANGRGAFAQDYSTRFGIQGPIMFASASPTGPRVRVGGAWGSPSGGADMGGKGFFDIAGGDFRMSGFEVAFCNGDGSPDTDDTHGISGVRVNADKYGDFEAYNSCFHDCNNGIESGEGPIKNTVHNCLFFNNGGQTVSSGQTHGAYLGGSYLDYQNNVSYNNNIGHCLKTRCDAGVILNNTLGDGENGSCSQPLNIPNGGRYLVQGNAFQKGTSPQNPFCLGYGEDGYGFDRDNTLTLTGNTFVAIGAPGTRSGAAGAIQFFPRLSTGPTTPGQLRAPTGALSRIIADGNRYYSKDGGAKLTVALDGFTSPTGSGATTPTLVETNATTLTLPPPISFADPGTANPPAASPGFFNDLFFYGGGDIANMDHVQIHSSALDIRIPASTPPGMVLTTLTAYGAQFYANDSATDPRINPFSGAGNMWAFTTAPEYFGSTADWADNTRFAIVAASDGLSATVRVGTAALPSGVYRIKVRITAADGTVADWRLYVVVTP